MLLLKCGGWVARVMCVREMPWGDQLNAAQFEHDPQFSVDLCSGRNKISPLQLICWLRCHAPDSLKGRKISVITRPRSTSPGTQPHPQHSSHRSLRLGHLRLFGTAFTCGVAAPESVCLLPLLIYSPTSFTWTYLVSLQWGQTIDQFLRLPDRPGRFPSVNSDQL